MWFCNQICIFYPSLNSFGESSPVCTVRWQVVRVIMSKQFISIQRGFTLKRSQKCERLGVVHTRLFYTCVQEISTSCWRNMAISTFNASNHVHLPGNTVSADVIFAWKQYFIEFAGFQLDFSSIELRVVVRWIQLFPLIRWKKRWWER